MGEVKDYHHITRLGWMKTRLGLKKNDFEFFAVVWSYSQNGKGKFEEGDGWLMEWMDIKSTTTLDEIKNRLEAQNLIFEGRTLFNKSVYWANVPLVEQLLSNDNNSVIQKMDNCPKNGELVIQKMDNSNININNNIIEVVEEEKEPDGLEVLRRWICESQLDEWFKKQAVSFWSLGPDTTRMVDGHNALDLSWYLSHFYEKIEVKERVEKSERMDTLKHFQNWLPKYLLLERENENGKTNVNRGPGSWKPSGSPVTERMLDRQAANEQGITIGGTIDLGF